MAGTHRFYSLIALSFVCHSCQYLLIASNPKLTSKANDTSTR